MIHCITWLWAQPHYRKKFTAQHVNTLRNMVERKLSLAHSFTCLTDTPKGLDPRIRVLPLPKVPDVRWSTSRPNCFRRLWAFSDEARTTVGERIVSFDLDCVITGSLDPLLGRKEDFVIWRDPFYPAQYNGSFWLMTAGSRRKVWDEFKGESSVQRMKGKRGSDQAWISHILGPNETTFTAKDGVYSYKRECKGALHKNARLVIFHGKPDPWEVELSWVKKHYA